MEVLKTGCILQLVDEICVEKISPGETQSRQGNNKLESSQKCAFVYVCD